MTARDMEFLISKCVGPMNFTATFYELAENGGNTCRNTLLWPEKMRRQYGEKVEKPFYFSFRKHGNESIMVWLRLNGLRKGDYTIEVDINTGETTCNS